VPPAETAVGLPPDSQAAIASRVCRLTVPGSWPKPCWSCLRSLARRSARSFFSSMRIAQCSCSTGRRSTAIVAVFVWGGPIWGALDSPPLAALAAPGRKRARRTGTIYVRFVSKRGTLGGPTPSFGDRRHTVAPASNDHHEARHAPPAASGLRGGNRAEIGALRGLGAGHLQMRASAEGGPLRQRARASESQAETSSLLSAQAPEQGRWAFLTRSGIGGGLR